jgi:hypothetical protein
MRCEAGNIGVFVLHVRAEKSSRANLRETEMSWRAAPGYTVGTAALTNVTSN